MIGKTVIGKGFKGAIRYVMEKPFAELLFMSGVSGENPDYIAEQFIAIADEKRSVSKPVWHTSLSFAYDDVISNELMIQICKDYLTEIGFDLSENQFIIVAHRDRPHSHAHIIGNRIGYDFQVVNDYYCKNRTAAVCDLLEKKYNLTIAKEQNLKNQNDSIPIRKNYKDKIENIIRKALNEEKVKNLKELSNFLQENHINMIVHKQSTGRIYGISFQIDNWKFKGSSINKDLSIKNILRDLDQNKEPISTNQYVFKNEPAKDKADYQQKNVSETTFTAVKIPFIPMSYGNYDQEGIERKKKKKKRRNDHSSENDFYR